jgi:hypothetical protein
MLITTIACFLAFLAVIYFFNPETGGILALSFFYGSLFLALIGTFSLLGLIARIFFTSDQLVFKKVVVSFRQGVWFSFLAVTCLFLKSFNLIAWKNVIFLILALALLELFFMSYKARPSQKI